MAEPFQLKNDTHLSIARWEQLDNNLIAGFTTRNGGVSKSHYSSLNFGFHVGDEAEEVLENRSILAESLSFPLDNWVTAEQVHGTEIAVAGKEELGSGARSLESALKGADGLITDQRGMLCTAFFADCVPLYFFDPVTEYIGIAHAGWKGTVNGIARKMTERMVEAGSDPRNLLVAIGPSISADFYEVDENVMKAVPTEFRDKCAIPRENNRFLLDLRELNAEILLQTGVIRHNIDITSFCSYREKDLFFSHRRDGGKTGRMLGYIGFMA